MPKFKTSFAMCWLLLTAVSLVYAQADAQKAYQDAKTAYQAGNFAEARDLAQKAAQTDAKNPEIFLLLGQAAYQLGQVDDAVAAWKQTLVLAPKEPFAARMLDVLQARRRRRCPNRLCRDAGCRKILQARRPRSQKTAFRQGHIRSAADQTAAHAGRVGHRPGQIGRGGTNHRRNPGAISSTRRSPANLLALGQGENRNRRPGNRRGNYVAQKLVAEHPGATAAISAQYELLLYDLKPEATTEKLEQLAKWIGENSKHVRGKQRPSGPGRMLFRIIQA